MNEHPSPEFEKELRETFRASRADPAFVHDLRASLLERATMKKQPRSFHRLAWGFAAAVLLIGLLAASPQVVQALKQLLGYVPGIGYMEQGNSLRILTKPVTLEKDGMKLTVAKGATDDEQTILLAYLEGYAPAPDRELNCEAPSRLVLPNGAILKPLRHESANTPGGSYYERYTFEPMPAGQLEALLEMPCIMSDPELTDFALQLRFAVAEEGQVMPLIELPAMAAMPAQGASAPLEGFTIVLEKETPTPDGYILSGSYEWTDPRFDAREASVHVAGVQIADANGQEVQFDILDPGSVLQPATKKLTFAYQVTGKDHAYPLTLKVNSIAVDLASGSTFQFDAGTDPQVGQVWDVNVDVPVGEHVIRVQSIELIAGATPTQLGYTFRMTSDPSVAGARIDDLDPAVSGDGGGGGGGGGHGNGVFECSWAFEGYSPAGPKTFVVSNITIMLEEKAQVTWQPTGQ